ncbi:Ribonuclease/ribotoxin [Xylariaceae sp. AK1471]|nr:Ribonuclease/ribotoxin [Xylariaceae sp. AK1471]
MWATQAFFLMAALSSAVLATPLGGEPQIRPRFGGYDCGGTRFTIADADNIFGDTVYNIRKNVVYHFHTARGDRTYPGVFNNGGAGGDELDPSPCAGQKLMEFPILASGAQYMGGYPGAHRVVVAESKSNPNSYDYCFLMTHQGAQGNLFEKCTKY